MTPSQALKIAVYAGQIMLSSGAETYRIEDTMARILKNYNFAPVEILVTTTGIFISIENDNSELFTMVKRVSVRTTHLGKIAAVNTFSRNLSEGKILEVNAFEKLKEIDKTPPYTKISRTVLCGVTCACFTYMFGGDLRSCCSSFLVGLLLYQFLILFNDHNVAAVLTNAMGGVLVATMALVFINLNLNEAIYLDKVIIGSIMPMVPGLTLTNSIRDILEGNYLSGTSRIADAILVAVAIATGVGTALKIWMYFFGGFVI